MKRRANKLFMIIMLLAIFIIPVPANASIKLNKRSLSILTNRTYTLRIVGYKGKVKWSSSNKKVATVSKKGVVKGKKKGKCKIIAAVGNKKYVCKVTIQQAVKSVKIEEKSVTFTGSGSINLNVQVLPRNAKNKKVQWHSSNTQVATVNSNGLVTAVGNGTATITAMAKDGSGKKSTCKIIVKGIIKKTPNLQPLRPFVTLTSTDPYKIYYYTEPSNVPVVWESSDESIATVTSDGVIHPIRDGEITITMRANDGSGAFKTIKVTIKIIKQFSKQILFNQYNYTDYLEPCKIPQIRYNASGEPIGLTMDFGFALKKEYTEGISWEDSYIGFNGIYKTKNISYTYLPDVVAIIPELTNGAIPSDEENKCSVSFERRVYQDSSDKLRLVNGAYKDRMIYCGIYYSDTSVNDRINYATSFMMGGIMGDLKYY